MSNRMATHPLTPSHTPTHTQTPPYLLNTEHCGGGFQHDGALEVVEDLVGVLADVEQGGYLQQLGQHVQGRAHERAELVRAAQVQ